MHLKLLLKQKTALDKYTRNFQRISQATLESRNLM